MSEGEGSDNVLVQVSLLPSCENGPWICSVVGTKSFAGPSAISTILGELRVLWRAIAVVGGGSV